MMPSRAIPRSAARRDKIMQYLIEKSRWIIYNINALEIINKGVEKVEGILDWINSSPSANVVSIILIVLAAIIVLKLAKNITRPIFIIVIVVTAVLLFFNILDLAMLSEYGKRMISCACSESPSAVSLADALL